MCGIYGYGKSGSETGLAGFKQHFAGRLSGMLKRLGFVENPVENVEETDYHVENCGISC